MCGCDALRFVSERDALREELPWGPHHWFCRPDLTGSEHLSLVRVAMPPGKAHAFHRHPCFEEVIYYLSGRAEQWIGKEKRVLRAGESVFVPRDEVHGTYNDFDEPCVFVVACAPARFDGPATLDMSQQEPWKSLRG